MTATITPNDQDNMNSAEQLQLGFFVYGTLRPGQRNYRVLVADIDHTTTAATLDGASMFCGPGFPYVSSGDGIVIGDLVTIDDPEIYEHVLARLDRLEGYRSLLDPMNHYDRVRRTVTTDAGDQEAWVYLVGPWFSDATDTPQRIESGDWLANPFDRGRSR